jgi:AcrR family transcriptional regulator
MAELRTPDRPLRADAERNRLKILAAAHEVFADRGFAASLDDIAAHARVGVGTVYRRFPDKDALIDALFEKRLEDVAAIGRRALAAEDPWQGFIAFMTEGIGLQAQDRGLRQAMLSRGHDRVEQARATIIPIASELIARAQQNGALRADLALTDIPLINMMVSATADLTRDVSPDAYRRMMQIVFDGLASSRSAPTPLPADPIDHDQLAVAIATHGCP